MKLMKCTLFLLLISVVEIKSSVQTVEPLHDVCFSTETIDSPLEDKVHPKKSVTCRGVKNVSQILESVVHDIEELIILESEINSKDVGKKDMKLDHVFSMKLINSIFNSAVIEWMSGMEHLQYLTIWNSTNSFAIKYDEVNIMTLDLDLTSFKNLQMVNISKVSIKDIKMKITDKLPQLDLSENSFECGNDFIWIMDAWHKNPNKVNLNDTNCFMKKIEEEVSYNPLVYSLRGKSFFPVLEYKREAKMKCPPKCICELKGLLTVDRPQLNMDCIGLNMTHLPDVIPKGTSRCNFSYNLIEDLTPLYNRVFDKVAMLVLSHNRIKFLDPVLFPDLLRRKRDAGIWLDNNLLSKFPAEGVDKVYEDFLFEGVRYMPQFLLGHNPFTCTCDYIGQFQNLIYKHMYDIYDSREIKCSTNDPYNPDLMILTVDVGTLCDSEPVMNNLDIVNIVLGLLLIVLIIDFIYRKYQYKKNRRLPWIVTKFQLQV